MEANCEEVANHWIEADRVSCAQKARCRLILKDVGWCLLGKEQVVDVDATVVRDGDENARSEGRPLHLHDVLVVAWLEDEDRSHVQCIVQAD